MKKHLVCRTSSMARKLYLRKIPVLPKLIWVFNRIVFACDIPFTANIDESVDFFHNALGVVVSSKTEIGPGCKIYQNVTFGGRTHKQRGNGHPVLGKNVVVYPGAVVLGPIKIGDNSVIGANAIVIEDLPPNTTAVGMPARIIEK